MPGRMRFILLLLGLALLAPAASAYVPCVDECPSGADAVVEAVCDVDCTVFAVVFGPSDPGSGCKPNC